MWILGLKGLIEFLLKTLYMAILLSCFCLHFPWIVLVDQVVLGGHGYTVSENYPLENITD